MAKLPPFSHLTQVKDMAAQTPKPLLWDRLEVLREGTEQEQNALTSGLKTSRSVPGLIQRARRIQAGEG